MDAYERVFGRLSWRTRAVRVGLLVLALVALTLIAASALGLTPDWMRGRKPPEDHGLGPLPPLETEPWFGQEIRSDEYPETDPPSKSPLLRWDFSGKRTYTYEYQHKERSYCKLTSHATLDFSAAKGRLRLEPQGNGRAVMHLKTTIFYEGKSDPPSLEMDPMTFQDVAEDGSFPEPSVYIGRYVRMLFALPAAPLRVGEAVDIPGTMPYLMYGSNVLGRGTIRVVLMKYVTIDGHKCAQLGADINIRSRDIPKELGGFYEHALSGKSVVYFDLEDRCIVSATQALVWSKRVKGPLPADRSLSVRIVDDGHLLIRLVRLTNAQQREAR